MMFKKALFGALLSIALVSANPVAQVDDITTTPRIPGLGEACGFIWGTKPCSIKSFKCCYRYPDAGYCLPFCPPKWPNF